MTKETVISKSELHTLLAEHIADNELAEIGSVTIADGRITISLEDIELDSATMVDIVAKAVDNPPDKVELIKMPDGSLGLQETITLR